MRAPSHGLVSAILALLLAGSGPAVAAPPIVPPPLAERSRPAPARFQDWRVACAGGCRALTRVTSAAPGRPEVLRLTVAPSGSGTFALTLRTPAPLYLPRPMTLLPDRADPVTAPWFTCDPEGCEARLTVGADFVAALRAGRSATVELALVDGARARLRLSLLGFTAALAAAEAAERAHPPVPVSP